MVVTTLAKLVPARSSHPPSRPHGPIHGCTHSPGGREAHFRRQPLLLTWLRLSMVIQPNLRLPASQDLVQSSSREAVQPEGCLARVPLSHPSCCQRIRFQRPPIPDFPWSITCRLKLSALTAWEFSCAAAVQNNIQASHLHYILIWPKPAELETLT